MRASIGVPNELISGGTPHFIFTFPNILDTTLYNVFVRQRLLMVAVEHDVHMDGQKGGDQMTKCLKNMDWGVTKKNRDMVDAKSSDGCLSDDIYQTYMTTREAAKYLRRSLSWISRQKDIPVYRGRPNVFRRDDLDEWMTKTRRYEPLI